MNPSSPNPHHGFWRLTLDTNPEDCNLACVMCEEHSPFSTFKADLWAATGQRHRRMPEAWLAGLFAQAKALGVREIIPSTMGEPLIYKHFGRIVELCAQHEIRLNLTTNGTFPRVSGKTAREWAALLVPVSSDIKLSWNGATAATSTAVMRGIDFDETLAHVRTLAEVRDAHAHATGHYCRLTFQLTFMQQNMHELADIVRLAAGLGIDRVKGHHLWAHFAEIQADSFRRDAASIAQWNAYVAEAHAAAAACPKPDGSTVLLENIIPLLPRETESVPEAYECPFLGRELWVSATGKISPCCAPDAQRESLGDFGNIQHRSLAQALQSPEYQALCRDYRSRPLCQACNMRKPPAP